ncbi:hypothetical protein, partial [Brucella suis]|uniref:hypothetical protein n=3 Tax=Brucella TaxID=234 RepID=UPI001AEBB687
IFEPYVRSTYAGKSVLWTDFRSRFDASDNAAKQRVRAVPLKQETLAANMPSAFSLPICRSRKGVFVFTAIFISEKLNTYAW